MKFDFVKLAKSNIIQLKWRSKLMSKIIRKERTPEVKAILDLLPARNFFGVMKFFMTNKSAATAILGKQFAKDYPKMFYASKIENDLIKSYVPAVFSMIRNQKLTNDQYEELTSRLLESLREIVWRFNRTDLKFTTYAITSLKNNTKFIMSDIISGKIGASENRCIHSEDENTYLTSFSGRQVTFDPKSTIQFADFINDLVGSVHLTTHENLCIKNFLQKKTYQRKTLNVVKNKFKEYIANNNNSLPHLEEILV